jgi:regulator of RNase E activity RraB
MVDTVDSATRIRNHLSRNAALMRLIESKGASLDALRKIECHFWAPTEKAANDLATELSARGFSTLRVNQSESLWNLEMVITQSARTTASERFTAEMTTTAERFTSIYDGWGTNI